MMTFFHSTGTCSMAARIVLEELGLPHSPIEVSFRRNIKLDELAKVNPMGAVPVIVTDDGKAITQNVAVLEYLADLKPSGNLLAPAGTWQRRETMSWLGLIAADLQKTYSPLFRLEQMTTNEGARKEVEAFYKEQVLDVLKTIDAKLADRDFVVGTSFTVADAYLFTLAGWAKWVEVDTRELKNLTRYMKGIYTRPAVQKVLELEDAMDWLQ